MSRMDDAAIREAMARAAKMTPRCPVSGSSRDVCNCPSCYAWVPSAFSSVAAEALARGTEVERLRLALREIAICDQDYRPLPGEASPFDWRRRSMKQEDIARKALGGSL